MAVSTAPASRPSAGFWKVMNSCRKAGTSAKPPTAEDMVSMPNISVAKPSSTVPVSFFLLSLQNMKKMIPTSASTGVKEVGFRSRTHMLSPLMPPRLSSHAVTVVPTLAPMMTLMACRRVMRPELTKPTTITVVAEELWITAVTPRPVKKPARRPVVILPSRERRRPPARRSSACPISVMPNRNRHSPPSMVNTSKILISVFLSAATGRHLFLHSFSQILYLISTLPAADKIQKRSFVKSM